MVNILNLLGFLITVKFSKNICFGLEPILTQNKSDESISGGSSQIEPQTVQTPQNDFQAGAEPVHQLSQDLVNALNIEQTYQPQAELIDRPSIGEADEVDGEQDDGFTSTAANQLRYDYDDQELMGGFYLSEYERLWMSNAFAKEFINRLEKNDELSSMEFDSFFEPLKKPEGQSANHTEGIHNLELRTENNDNQFLISSTFTPSTHVDSTDNVYTSSGFGSSSSIELDAKLDIGSKDHTQDSHYLERSSEYNDNQLLPSIQNTPDIFTEDTDNSSEQDIDSSFEFIEKPDGESEEFQNTPPSTTEDTYNSSEQDIDSSFEFIEKPDGESEEFQSNVSVLDKALSGSSKSKPSYAMVFERKDGSIDDGKCRMELSPSPENHDDWSSSFKFWSKKLLRPLNSFTATSGNTPASATEDTNNSSEQDIDSSFEFIEKPDGESEELQSNAPESDEALSGSSKNAQRTFLRKSQSNSGEAASYKRGEGTLADGEGRMEPSSDFSSENFPTPSPRNSFENPKRFTEVINNSTLSDSDLSSELKEEPVDDQLINKNVPEFNKIFSRSFIWGSMQNHLNKIKSFAKNVFSRKEEDSTGTDQYVERLPKDATNKRLIESERYPTSKEGLNEAMGETKQLNTTVSNSLEKPYPELPGNKLRKPMSRFASTKLIIIQDDSQKKLDETKLVLGKEKTGSRRMFLVTILLVAMTVAIVAAIVYLTSKSSL